jgi:hypothetical protein
MPPGGDQSLTQGLERMQEPLAEAFRCCRSRRLTMRATLAVSLAVALGSAA